MRVGTGTSGVPRGIGNNNPLNLEFDPATRWGGLDEPASDGRFCRFRSPVFGLRAACKVLLAYQDRHGLDTVLSILNRFAPPSENDTGSYAFSVARRVGVGINDRIDLHQSDTLRLVLGAMIRQENGQQPYPDATLDEAMSLAGLKIIQPTQGENA